MNRSHKEFFRRIQLLATVAASIAIGAGVFTDSSRVRVISAIVALLCAEAHALVWVVKRELSRWAY